MDPPSHVNGCRQPRPWDGRGDERRHTSWNATEPRRCWDVERRNCWMRKKQRRGDAREASTVHAEDGPGTSTTSETHCRNDGFESRRRSLQSHHPCCVFCEAFATSATFENVHRAAPTQRHSRNAKTLFRCPTVHDEHSAHVLKFELSHKR